MAHLLIKLLSVALLLTSRATPSWAWLSTTASAPPRLLVLSSSSSDNVDTIRLDGLGDNHQQVGDALALSVQRWLDAEWMPQDIHRQMGQSASDSYVHCRTAAQTDDIMAIMTAVAEDLQQVWDEKYDAEAFVNAWDVANYVSDYLTQQAGNESCGCSAQIH